jgi:hypothetical protein
VLLWIFNFCSSVTDNSVLLGYDTVSLANQIPTFQSKSVLTSKSQNGHFLTLQDVDSTLPENTIVLLHIYITLYPKRMEFLM